MKHSNPLIETWQEPYGLPPFARIKASHFPEALAWAIKESEREIDDLAGSKEAPDFHNTIERLDLSSDSFERIVSAFGCLCADASSDELRAVELEWMPRIAAHVSSMYLNAKLFSRVHAVYEARAKLALDPEQLRLVERIHMNFTMAGALLKPEQKKRYAEIVERLSVLTVTFVQYVTGDEGNYRLELKGEADLAGLPDFFRAAAREAAIEAGIKDGWVVTLSRSLIEPFLTFSERRDLRETAFKAWQARGEMVAERDTRPIAAEILKLRIEQARLHGFDNYADYALRDRMALNAANVSKLLERVWEPALLKAREEMKDLEDWAAQHGHKVKLEPWDWRFYAERVRSERYAIDESEIKPYFQLDNIIAAAFYCAQKLFGVRFEEKPGLTLQHPDSRLWEVRDAATSALVGVFIGDYFGRKDKQSGAWMTAYRTQSRKGQDGKPVFPIITNDNNFAKSSPCLLSFDDARTLFHEFGHGLHGLLSDVQYRTLSGTSVLRDFVELPSQLFEHWIDEPEVLKKFALHYQTGEAIPDALIEKLKAARKFNQGFLTVQYLGPALLDMALHQRSSVDGLDLDEFESAECKRLGLPREVGLRHRLPHFQHIFGGDSYAAGYYVYMWAEVLEADAYEAFVEAGDPFDPKTAALLKKHIYSAGNSVEPSATYRAFRGRDPQVEALLDQRGLK